MILFNAPIQFADHTARAVKMAMEMRDAIGALTERWRNRGHSLGFGVGIALGYATLGQIGFEHRLEYAAIGSVTNLASRLCDEAKAGQVVVSPARLRHGRDITSTPRRSMICTSRASIIRCWRWRSCAGARRRSHTGSAIPPPRERSEWWGGWREAPGGGCFRALH